MPKALTVDRQMARELFVQGLKTDEIGRRLGVNKLTVGTWIRRYRWAKFKSDTVAVLTQEFRKPMLSDEVASQSLALRQSISAKLVEAREVLAKSTPPNSLSSLQRQQQQIEPLIDNAKKVFGWNETAVDAFVSITSLSCDIPQTDEATNNPIPLPKTLTEPPQYHSTSTKQV